MIVKLTLAGCLLASGLGLVAPLAVAMNGSDTCVATQSDSSTSECRRLVRSSWQNGAISISGDALR